MKRLFLAGPFKSLVDPTTGRMSDKDIDLFNRIILFFEDRNWEVHSAHRRERCGHRPLTGFLIDIGRRYVPIDGYRTSVRQAASLEP
jgi:hypothetical protein